MKKTVTLSFSSTSYDREEDDDDDDEYEAGSDSEASSTYAFDPFEREANLRHAFDPNTDNLCLSCGALTSNVHANTGRLLCNNVCFDAFYHISANQLTNAKRRKRRSQSQRKALAPPVAARVLHQKVRLPRRKDRL